MKAMVLAAGKGTRLKPITSIIPKPIAPVVGKPIIEHIFELLARTGVTEAYANVCYLADAILDYYGAETSIDGMSVSFSREERLLGTAGGVKRLASIVDVDETFVIVMGDALTDVDVRDVVAFHKEKGALATLALMRVQDTSQYGVVELDDAGNIISFQEKPDPEEALSNMANTGIYVLEPGVLDYVPEGEFFDFANDLFPRLLEAGERFVGYEGDFFWSDVGNLEAYKAAQRDVLTGKVRVNIPGEWHANGLWTDRSARLHPAADVRGSVVIGPDAIVDAGVTLADDVIVGAGCQILQNATVRRSILLPGACVEEGAYLENCIVGPGYRVRSGDLIIDQTLFYEPRGEDRHTQIVNEPLNAA